jgi:D-3-phosphoglycerate dehydrogenase
MRTVVVTPHRFRDLEPEQTTLAPLDAEVIAAADVDELRRRAPDAEAMLVSSFVRIDGDLISTLGKCRAIVRYGIGVNEVDVDAATKAGIPVGNVPDASVNEVADHAVMLALATLRRLPETSRSLAEGSWDLSHLRGVRRISGLTAGILGLGRIGRAVAHRLQAFGMDVVVYDPFVADSPYPLLELDELLDRSDVVSIHLPLTPETQGLLSDERLGLLGPGAVIVNVARGGIVDEEALARRLHDGSLWGAGIDVFAEEPLRPDHPLRSAPHALLTPHAAWTSVEAIRELQWRAAEQVARALRGERLDPVVNPAVYG